MGNAKKLKNDNALVATVEFGGDQSKKISQYFNIFKMKCFNAAPVIAVLRLSGTIGKVGVRGGLAIDSLNDSIERAFNQSKLTAVCLIINSPGGSPVQSDLISARITYLAKTKDIPVYSFVEDVAASGGYWLACAGDEIYASRSSIIGSIGVVARGFGFHGVLEKLGIERRVYTEGKNKSILDPFEKEKISDVKIIKNAQKNIHNHFIDYIKSRRKSRLTQSDEILFNGEFWTAETARDFGLIDGIDNLYDFIKRKFGDNVKIKYIIQKESWIRRKLNVYLPQVISNVADVIKSELTD